MISITKEQLCNKLPQFRLIQDEELRDTTAQIWIEACSKSDWSALEDIPFMPGSDAKQFSFLHHVALVAQYSYEVAKVYNNLEELPLSMDHTVAGALLHDVCKIAEYSSAGGRTAWGQRVTHGIYGVSLCQKYRIPLDIIHIVASHTNKLSMAPKTPEAVIVSKCDAIAAGCVHLSEN